jgi:hypothetical protein
MNLEILSWRTDTLWLEVAIVCGLTAFGSIFFGHFEEETPKWRRVLKLVAMNIITVALSALLGRPWAFGFLGLMLAAVVVVHGWWLPKNGINGLTGEPKEKYYELRGWKKKTA